MEVWEKVSWYFMGLYALGRHVQQADLLPALDYIREHGSTADIHEIESLTLNHLRRINNA
jgi:hypothetical protein